MDSLLAHIAPFTCIACETEGSLLCRNCVSLLGERLPSRCFRCLSPADHFLVCADCSATTSVRCVAAHYDYKGYAKQLVQAFKFQGKRGAAKEVAALMTARIPAGAVLVHVPTATTRVRERGYDHAKLLAQEVSRLKRVPHLTLLARQTQVRQVGADKKERVNRIAGAFRVINSVQGAHIILIDDVVTTGATLSEAASVLMRAGARCVDALVFAATPPNYP